jgi:sulfotransferase
MQINNKKQFVCLSGLPRSGSTLLSAILSQNPKIHAEGNSPVCQIMWDIYISCTTSASEQIYANNKSKSIFDILSNIPNLYYKDIPDTEDIIIDKSRSWTLDANVKILKTFIDPNIKIIVLERPMNEILKSFIKLYQKNNQDFNVSNILKPMSEPLMRSFSGLQWAKNNNKENNFLFIKYSELVLNPKKQLDLIYNFLNLDYFEHQFNNIQVKYQENDNIYKLQGMHTIRNTIEIIENEIDLDKEIISICNQYDKLLL